MNRALYARLGLTCFHSPVACIQPAVRFSSSRQIRLPRVLPQKLPTFTANRTPKIHLQPAIKGNAFSRAFHTSIMNGNNGTLRAKRKNIDPTTSERPSKQQRAMNGKESAGENTPEVGSLFENEIDIDEMEETRIIPGLADSAEWQATIEQVVRNVVSIRFCQTCSFDTDPALTSEATGFVVDAEKG